MENNIVIFENEDFGKVRTLEVDKEFWFVGKDLVDILGYQNGSRDINRHTDNEDRIKRKIFDGVQPRETILINESGLYSLILSSKLESAKRFKRWVTSEVLPELRKTGGYKRKQVKQDKQPSLSAVNSAVKILTQLYKDADVAPQFIAIEVTNTYNQKAGFNLKTPPVTIDQSYFDKEEIAETVGVYSLQGNKHSRAIGAVIAMIDIDEDEQIKVPYSNNGHSGVTTKYSESVLEKVKAWFQENNYPQEIVYNATSYSVAYDAMKQEYI